MTPADVAIAARKRAFVERLIAQPDSRAVVDEFVLHGTSHALSDAAHYDLKQRIATNFGVSATTEVFVVGSAKLGFSISPKQRWKSFDDGSDVDVAIVSHDLYQRVWHEIDDYVRSGADWPRRADFLEYHGRGWFRPDMAPPSPILVMGNLWWEFFRELKELRLAGPRKINAAVYHDMHFLREYQASAVDACREVS